MKPTKFTTGGQPKRKVINLLEPDRNEDPLEPKWTNASKHAIKYAVGHEHPTLTTAKMQLDPAFEFTVGNGGKDSGRGLLLTYVGDEECKIARPIIDVGIHWKHVKHLSIFDVFIRKDDFYYWQIATKLVPGKMKKASPAKRDFRWYWKAPKLHLCNVLNTSDWNGTDKKATVESQILLGEDDKLHLQYWCLMDFGNLGVRSFQAVDNHRLAQLEVKTEQGKTPSPYEDTPDPVSDRGKRLAQVEVKFGDLHHTFICGRRDLVGGFKMRHDACDRMITRYVVDLRQDKEGSVILWHVPPTPYQGEQLDESLAGTIPTKIDMAFLRAVSKVNVKEVVPARVARKHFEYWNPQMEESDDGSGDETLASVKAAKIKAAEEKNKSTEEPTKSSSSATKDDASVKGVLGPAESATKDDASVKGVLGPADKEDDADADGYVTVISPGGTPTKKLPAPPGEGYAIRTYGIEPRSTQDRSTTKVFPGSYESPPPKKRKLSHDHDVCSTTETYSKTAPQTQAEALTQAQAEVLRYKTGFTQLVEMCRDLVRENTRLTNLTQTVQAGTSQLAEESARVQYWRDVAQRESKSAEAARKSAEAVRSSAAASVRQLEAQLLDTVNTYNAERTAWSQHLERSFSSASQSWERAQQATSMLLGSQMMGGSVGMAQPQFPRLGMSSPMAQPQLPRFGMSSPRLGMSSPRLGMSSPRLGMPSSLPMSQQSWEHRGDVAVSYHPVSHQMGVAEPQRRLSGGQHYPSGVSEVDESRFRSVGYVQDERRVSTGHTSSHAPVSRDGQSQIDGVMRRNRFQIPTSRPVRDRTGQYVEGPDVANALPQPAAAPAATPAAALAAAPATAKLNELLQYVNNK